MEKTTNTVTLIVRVELCGVVHNVPQLKDNVGKIFRLRYYTNRI